MKHFWFQPIFIFLAALLLSLPPPALAARYQGLDSARKVEQVPYLKRLFSSHSSFDRRIAADLMANQQLDDATTNLLLVGLSKDYDNWTYYFVIRALGGADISATKQKEAAKGINRFCLDKSKPLWLRKEAAVQINRLTGKPQKYLLDNQKMGQIGR